MVQDFQMLCVILKVKPSEMTWKIGLDCLTIGATKNGAFAAEAIIFFNKKKYVIINFFKKEVVML